MASGLHPQIVMKIAIPVWKDRVSPVFDVARSIRIIDIHNGCVAGRSNRQLKKHERARVLADLGVDLLICAAISTSLESTIWLSGVEVISDTCGTPEEIIEAYLAGPGALARLRSPGIARKRFDSEASPSGQRRRSVIRN
jgi:predicted Fe-Mo cluster-binding NifX family protein